MAKRVSTTPSRWFPSHPAVDPAPAMDLLSPTFFKDPYPTFSRLRQSRPVFWSAQWRRWVLTRYDDVADVLRDTARFSSDVVPRLGTAGEKGDFARFAGAMPRWLFFLDGPAHASARAPYAPPFTPAAVAELAPLVRLVVEELLDRVAPSGTMDGIWDLAFPLPATVLAELLCPPGDRAALVGWARNMAHASAEAGDPGSRRRGIAATGALASYFQELVADRRSRPGGPLFERFVARLESPRKPGQPAPPLDEADLCAQCLLMLCAGNETTQHLIGNALLALLRNPGQLALLRDVPDADLPNAIDELLRFDSPVQSVNRRAVFDVELHSSRVRAGEELVLLLSAANRDPARFPDPDRLDLRRRDVAHLSFGYGAHYCLGAALARLEAGEALRTLLRRFRNLRLASGPQRWRTHDPALRGLRSLPLRFDR